MAPQENASLQSRGSDRKQRSGYICGRARRGMYAAHPTCRRAGRPEKNCCAVTPPVIAPFFGGSPTIMEKRKRQRPAPPAGGDFTLAEWCQLRRISLAMFYKLDGQGKGQQGLARCENNPAGRIISAQNELSTKSYARARATPARTPIKRDSPTPRRGALRPVCRW